MKKKSTRAPAQAPRAATGRPRREAPSSAGTMAMTTMMARTFQYPTGALRRAYRWACVTTSGNTFPSKA